MEHKYVYFITNWGTIAPICLSSLGNLTETSSVHDADAQVKA